MFQAYEEIPEDLIEKGKTLALNIWHLISPLAPVALASIRAHDAANCCEHAWMAACDKELIYNLTIFRITEQITSPMISLTFGVIEKIIDLL